MSAGPSALRGSAKKKAISPPKVRRSSWSSEPGWGSEEEPKVQAKEQLVDEVEDEVDYDFAETWRFFESQDIYKKGALRRAVRSGPVHGMSHPPQNPEVQRELMLHLQRCGLRGKAERRPLRQSVSRSSAMSGDRSRSLPVSPGSARGGGGADARDAPASGSIPPSPAPSKGFEKSSEKWTLPWAPDEPITGYDRAASRRAASRGAGGAGATAGGAGGDLSAAELWAQFRQEFGKVDAPPPTVSFVELRRWGDRLHSQSRELGFELACRSTKDCADLAMYHGRLTRSRSQPFVAKSDGQAAIAMRDLTAKKKKVDDSIRTAEEELRPVRYEKFSRMAEREFRPEKPPLEVSLRAVRGGSSQKMLRAADAVMHASPSRLQFMADVMGVSLATGRSPHRDATEWLYGQVAQA